MLGFLIGTACLIGLVKVVRAGRCGSGYGGGCGSRHGRGWGHDHGHRHGHGGGWGGGPWARGGSGFWLRGVFERLDTTPGQEKVIKQSVDEIFEATKVARGELDRTRGDIATALRVGNVDETAMGELFARHDDALREIRKAFVGSIAKVSDALDEEQRKKLADLIERGLGRGGFGRSGGPYRDRGDWA